MTESWQNGYCTGLVPKGSRWEKPAPEGIGVVKPMGEIGCKRWM